MTPLQLYTTRTREADKIIRRAPQLDAQLFEIVQRVGGSARTSLTAA